MTVKEIAEKQGIPLDYLEHLINPLISSGIIRSVRGKKGGIILARPADQINVKEIVEQLDGPVNPVGCISDAKSCNRSGLCATQDVWIDVKKAVDNVLNQYDVTGPGRKSKNKTASTGMYYI